MFLGLAGLKFGRPSRLVACVLALATVIVLTDYSGGQSPPAPRRTGADVCAQQLAKIKGNHIDKLLAEARSALANGLGPEALAVCREVQALQPENKMVAHLALRAETAIKTAAARPPTKAKLNSLAAARQALAERLGNARKDVIAKYFALAQSYEEKNLLADKARCLAEVIAMDPGNEQAHVGRGDKFIPEFGWVKDEIQRKWAEGLWFENGQWMKWEDVSKARIDALKAREAQNLGKGFRYSATHHLTIANNLTDAEYEKHMIQALELCVCDQRVRLFEPFVLAGR